MSKHQTPDFRGPRGSGSHLVPDARRGTASKSRGQYPADAGGPPETKVGPYGSQGDSQTPAKPQPDLVPQRAARKTTASNTLTNPIK